MSEPALQPSDNRERVIVERRVIPRRSTLEPVVVKFDSQHVESVESKRVDIAVTDACPVPELDAQLVRRIGCPDEVAFIDLEKCIEQVDLRYCGLANSDSADLVRFDELNLKVGHSPHDL